MYIVTSIFISTY